MSPVVQALIVAATSIGASSGFWTYIQSRDKTKDARTLLLMNLAYSEIMKVGMRHITQGWISRDDLEDLRNNLYGPYLELGGNGIAKRVMEEVDRLPLKQPHRYARRNNSSETEDHGQQ